MGEQIKDVEIYGLKGTMSKPRISSGGVFRAFLDSGSSRTVVSERVLSIVSSVSVPFRFRLGKEVLPSRLLGIRLVHRDCSVYPLVVGVSDEIVSRAGKKIDVLIGHDYMQHVRIALGFSDDPKEEYAVCRTENDRPRVRRANAR